MQKAPINFQDTFLAKTRRAGTLVTVFLMNGFQMHGVISGYDSFVVVLDSDGKPANDLQARHFHHYPHAPHRL